MLKRRYACALVGLMCLGWTAQCVKHAEEELLSMLLRKMLRGARIARARLVYGESPRTLALHDLSRNLVHPTRD